MKRNILKRLERKVNLINYQYKNDESSIIDHYNSLKKVFYDFADNEQDYSFKKYFNNIIKGSDLLDNYPNSIVNADFYYYFENIGDVRLISHDFLKKISKNILEDLKKRNVSIKSIVETQDCFICKVNLEKKKTKKTIYITFEKKDVYSFGFNDCLSIRKNIELAIKNLVYCNFKKYIEE